jgi:hypothetical protein
MKTPLRVAALSALLLSGMAHAAEQLTIDRTPRCQLWLLQSLDFPPCRRTASRSMTMSRPT